jgi:molybdopterin/thiamine biosynthesis adenylyltransferase
MEAMDSEMLAQIRGGARSVKDPAGRDVQVLQDHEALEIASQFGRSLREVYMEALGLGICPYRYFRNHDALSLAEQLELARARVSVVGAGGLGGQIILLLARMGIGHLVVVDHDLFDETNLNRQALSSIAALGKSKSKEAVSVLAGVNPGVEVTALQVRMDPSTALDILTGSHVIVDALDSVRDRLSLEEAAKGLGIPLVHGALAGFQGQVMTIFPEDAGLRQIYGGLTDVGKGFKTPEAVLGVPAPTPALVATLQVMEVLKIILRRGNILRNKMAYVDLEGGDLKIFSF